MEEEKRRGRGRKGEGERDGRDGMKERKDSSFKYQILKKIKNIYQILECIRAALGDYQQGLCGQKTAGDIIRKSTELTFEIRTGCWECQSMNLKSY